jgi:hypothetical protein
MLKSYVGKLGSMNEEATTRDAFFVCVQQHPSGVTQTLDIPKDHMTNTIPLPHVD